MSGQIIEDGRIHEGHRARMRAKLAAHGSGIFDTYELLEMLLYSVVPMKDTNPIAKRLLSAFGSLDGVFRAGREELLGVSGVGERVADLIIAAGRIESVLDSEEEIGDVIFSDYDRVGAAFVEHFRGCESPKVAAMLLDNNMRLLSLEDVFDCDYDNATVRPKKLIDLALKARASIIITAHLHPHGPLYPTPGDRATGSVISTALSAVGVSMIEHFIVTGNRYVGTLSALPSRLAANSRIHEFYESRELSENK